MTDTTTPAAAPSAAQARSLEDSVDALAWAADRIHRALQQAELLRDGADYHLVVTHEGAITAARPDGSRRRRRPDVRATDSVLGAYRQLAEALEREYANAALALAYGAHWALAEVLAGRAPERAEVAYDEPGRGGHPIGTVTALQGLVDSAAKEISAALQELNRCAYAAAVAEDLAGQDYIADHEASQMFDAGQVAEGLAAAAHAYGLACQRWLPLTLRYAAEAAAAAAAAVPAAGTAGVEG